jgi:hypothetical protein
MSRRLLAEPPALADLARALAPHLVAQALVVATLVAWPALAHWGDDTTRATPVLSEQEIERLMNEASRPDPKR